MTTAPTATRLMNGAKLLGALWNGGTRCLHQWAHCEKSARDHERTKFCSAKYQWLKLAIGERAAIKHSSREDRYGPTFVFDCMTNEERDATGVTMKLEIPEIGLVAVGSKAQVSFSAMEKIGHDGLAAVIEILRKFPGAKVIT